MTIFFDPPRVQVFLLWGKSNFYSKCSHYHQIRQTSEVTNGINSGTFWVNGFMKAGKQIYRYLGKNPGQIDGFIIEKLSNMLTLVLSFNILWLKKYSLSKNCISLNHYF
jgi:hypothetical protein